MHERLAELLDLDGIADEVGVVVRQQAVVAVRNDHALVAEDHARENRLWHFEILQRDVRQRRVTRHLRLEEAHLAACEVLDVERGGRHEDAIDLARCDQFGIQHEVDVEVLLQVFLRFRKELHVADACDRVRDAVLLREDARDHVDLVARRHGDEDVRRADVGIVHRDGAGAVRRDRQHVERVLRRFEPRLVLIDEHDIELLVREQLGDAVA